MPSMPIAIVGRACVFPGALRPSELWDLVAQGRDQIAPAPPGRWGTGPDDILCGPDDPTTDHAWTDRGGYVEGFERVWNPEGFGVPADSLADLDPLFTWVLHCAREALRDAGDDRAGAISRPRVRAVLGNLSFPTLGMNRHAQSVWSPTPGEPPVDPRNRFMSSGPAMLLEQALGLCPGAFCLDSACASSLYAMAIACAQLQDGVADMVLAGAINRADDLFLHVGFCALQALSRSGRSRPFHAEADGLLPAEGAGVVALKRLADARRDGDRVYGVIRGIGLSNDGRGRGFLAPSEEGQRRAVAAAYEDAALSPSAVSLIECHATGTTVGDATELRSTAAVFEGCTDVPIGSLKSNLGHLITAAGIAGLIKVLEAMRHQQRPPSLHAEQPTPALEGSPFRVLTRAEPWPSDGPRVAGISAFGFGGNNAHLVVSEDDPSLEIPARPSPPPATPLAVVGVGAIVGSAGDAEAFAHAVREGQSMVRPAQDGRPAGARIDAVSLSIEGLCFPPRDLQRTLAQQLLVLGAAREATAAGPTLPRDRTGIYVAMEADPEVCRYGVRWRLPERLRRAGGSGEPPAPELWDAIAPRLGAEEVVGTMPNIPANRLNRQLDIGGPSFTVAAGEASGRVALELAVRALGTRQLDTVVVGGADLCCHPVHEAALAALEGATDAPGDAASALVLRRLDDALEAGDPVLAVLNADPDAVADPDARPLDRTALRERLGRCWAAGDLRDVTAAILTCGDDDRPARTSIEARPGGVGFSVHAPAEPAAALEPPGQLYRFAAANPKRLRERLRDHRPGGDGPSRAAILAVDQAQLHVRCAQAIALLDEGASVAPGIFVAPRPVEGDIAFVFAGAGAAHPGMGTALVRALPQLDATLRARSPGLAREFDRAWADDQAPPLQRLWSSSYLTQLHAELTQAWLEIQPDAVIGYSSGESNALFASGIWSDHDDMIAHCRDGGLFTEQIGGSLRAVAAAWEREPAWETWTVLAPVTQVLAAVEGEPRVHVSIIHHDRECVVAGDPEGCARVRTALSTAHWSRLHYDLAVHVPELSQVAEEWRQLHRRPVTPPRPGLRVYSGAHAGSYEPSDDACAEAILEQANRRLDVRAVIEQAYEDGVRIFVEHGPQGSCARWIREILGERDAVIVALDRRRGGLTPVLETIGALWSAGVPLRLDPRLERLGQRDASTTPPANLLHLQTRPQPLHMPPLSTLVARSQRPEPEPKPAPSAMQPMPPAPALPPVGSVPPPLPPLPPAAMPPAAPVGAAPLAATSPSAPSFATVMQAQLAQLAERQRAFVEQQTALHQRFLEVRAHAVQMLVDASTGTAAAPVLPPAVAQTPRAPTPPPPPVPVTAPPPPAPTSIPVTRPEPAAAPTSTPAPVPQPSPAAPSPAPIPPPRPPCGPTFDRAALEVHAGGDISTIYGPAFADQDHHERQVRMPMPPLLLADRVTGLDAEPMSMKQGTIWTETDVTDDAWYLHEGRMPPGVMIESGQADLMLISYLGVDAENQGERVYRLLGCTLTYHGSPPEVGETLCFDIHLDGHAKQGRSRLMFFHYDCHIDGQVRLSVRQGQAGFFTEAELADSDGCLWRPEDQTIVSEPRLDPPAIETRSSFDPDEVRAFAQGRPWECFGEGLALTRCHTRTPRIQHGRMQLLHQVDRFEPRGGPWGRGYLKATTPITPDDWFFEGHFKNDPCMPGTLMFEGCLQALAFHLAGLGYTAEHDGWRFEPVPEHAMPLSCRGQVTPSSQRLTYEVFVEEVFAGPEPTIYADLLCTVDGLKAFHARRVGLRLVPAWPLDQGHVLLRPGEEDPPDRPLARSGDFVLGHHSMLACACGRPTEAFGPIYARFDGVEPVARLPNPPYHFISRAVRVEGEAGAMQQGMAVDVEFDIDPHAWYFADNGCRTMPFAVLLEAALQPCGWLASYMGCALTVDQPLMFRNLDGHGTQHREILPDDGILFTKVRNTQLSVTASMIIVGFEVECSIDDAPVYSMSTVFGFFPASAFENQAGLPTTDEQRALFDIEDPQGPRPVDPAAIDRPRMAAPMLMMLDQVTHFDPDGGASGLGSARAHKDVDPSEWFFAAHFFQDPVQPGSLGVEAMLQLLQWCMRELSLDAGIESPRFEPLALGHEITWKYRGQVVPTNRRITSTLEITERGTDERGAFAVADASLWIDGKQIYAATGVGMRIVAGPLEYGRPHTLSLASHPWLADHRPTWTVPAVPMMSMLELLTDAVRADERLVGLRDVRVKGWLVVPDYGERHLQVARDGDEVQLLAIDVGDSPRPVATARLAIGLSGDRPAPWPALTGEPAPSPYADGSLFHGPAFQRLEHLVVGPNGASSVLRVDSPIPTGRLAPALLDAATHGIPHDALHRWDPKIPEDRVAYPAWIPQLDVYGPPPTTGSMRCEVRYRGPMGSPEFPSFEIQLIGEHGVWCQLRLVEACFPKGRLGRAPAPLRRSFLRDHLPVPGLSLSRRADRQTRLSTEEVDASNWLPGTIAAVYGSEDAEEIAQAEHIAAAHGIHPRQVRQALPLTSWSLGSRREGNDVVIDGDGMGRLDITPVREFWGRWFGRRDWPVEDVYYGLLERFLRRVVVTDPEAFGALKGRSALFLANHQVGVESVLFTILASALTEVPTMTLAKAEHRQTWLGQLIEHCFAYPGIDDPEVIAFFDRSDPASLPAMLQGFAARMSKEARSMMVHVEGTRSRSCAEPVRALSGAFLDLALSAGVPVVPVRFCGGLPREAVDDRLEFPVDMGRQDVWFGRPILPEELSAWTYGERRQRVMDAINALGPGHEHEQPLPGDPSFERAVAQWQAQCGVSRSYATLGQVLAERDEPSPEIRTLLDAPDAEALADDESDTGRWLHRLASWLLG